MRWSCGDKDADFDPQADLMSAVVVAVAAGVVGASAKTDMDSAVSKGGRRQGPCSLPTATEGVG